MLKKADEVLYYAVKGISDLIMVPGLINLDFADVRAVMGESGFAMMGTGIATGESRAKEAAMKAITSPLLEGVSIDGARHVLMNVTCGPDLTIDEVSEAASIVQEAAHDDVHVFFGTVCDDSAKDEMRITVIATGIDTLQLTDTGTSATAPEKRAALRKALETVYDIERLSTRIFLGRGMPKDCVALRASIAALEGVALALAVTVKGQYSTADEAHGATMPVALQNLCRQWDPLSDLQDLLTKALADNPPPTLTEGGLFKAGYSPNLDTLIDLMEHGEQRLAALLVKEQAENALPKLKLGYNRVFGYYLELSKANTGEVPPHFIRRQTVANAERFVTPALKELEEAILAAGEKRKSLEYSLFQDLRDRIIQLRPRILFMASLLAALDFWQALAEVAHKHNWVRPTL
ncbi:hypothetical protein B566_EDAN018460, partial [Ephemera danica]